MFNPVLNCSHTCVKRVYKQHEQINCLQLFTIVAKNNVAI